MSMKRSLAATIGAVIGVTLYVPAAFAGFYPTQDCVAAKLKAASKLCQSELKAWAKWDSSQDAGARDAAITAAKGKLSDAFSKADTKAAGKDVDCSQTSLTGTEMGTAIDTAVGSVVTSINTGLTLPADGKCGGKLLKTAGGACQGLLKDEAGFFQKFGVDPTGTGRDAKNSTVTQKFTDKYNQTVMAGCPATTTPSAALNDIASLRDDAVTNTTTSPDLSTSWTEVTPPFNTPYLGTSLHPICSHGTAYSFFYKRGSGADVNKLLVYYEGGGACWDSLTCSQPVYDPDVTASDNPANATTGFADPNNSPFRNWSSVFIAYCTGDVHWGNKTDNGIQHKGFINAKVVEKFAREHFVNPSEVFVTGSSAGAYGAILHGIYLHEVYLASTFNVMGDAGAGVITPEFRQTQENAWGIQANLPTYIGLGDVTQLTIADLYADAANYYATPGVHHFAPRGSRFGHYTTAHDNVQTLFYNIMVNGILDFGSWWHATCDWSRQAVQLAADAAGAATNSNYKYYIAPGSRHTMWGTNRVYTETHGGVQLVVDWVNDMRSSPTWGNVACTDCSLLGSCAGGTNAGASCQHDSECPGGGCNQTGSCNGGANQGGSCQYDSDCPGSTCGNWDDARPDFKCSSGSVNANATCQRDADCIGGTCQVEAPFGVCKATSANTCAGGANAGAVCTMDSECPSSTCSTTANTLCSTDADCDGTSGSCVSEQPFQLDGIVSCPP